MMGRSEDEVGYMRVDVRTGRVMRLSVLILAAGAAGACLIGSVGAAGAWRHDDDWDGFL